MNDPNPLYAGPQAIVPPPLLGGVVSCLLGVELPGPGTNWLKQEYRFPGAVAVGEEVRTSVEIVRLRPDKALVNLVDVATTARGIVMEGDTLVLAADVAPRHEA